MVKIKGKKVPMEKFLREYIQHEDLYNKACKTDRYKRLLAYQTLAKNLDTSPWHARTLERRFRKAFYTKMQSLVRQGITDFEDLPKEPPWLRVVEAKLNVLPTLVQEHTARGQRSRTSPDEVVSALCMQAAARGSLCARDSYVLVARALKLHVPVNDLHAAWIAAQRVSMRYLALTSRAGDDPKTALSLSHAQVADVVLLNTDVKTHRIVTDESDRSYPEAVALSFLWQLVRAHRLEERAPPRSRVRAQRWTRAYRDYLDSNRLASLVVLQRRWYELKLRTHTRMRARLGARYRTTTEYNAMPAPPTALDLDIVQRYPHVVTHPLPSWRSLVRSGTIVTQLLSDDDSDQEEDKNINEPPDNITLTPTNESIEDASQNKVNTDVMEQEDVMIIDSHSSNMPCSTRRGLVAVGINGVGDVTSDAPKPAIEEVLKNIDPRTVKTEVIIDSDPEIEPYDKDNMNQNDDSKDDIKDELANENEPNDVDSKDQIVVKQEPGVSMASRIIFLSDEEDISSGKTSSDVTPTLSPETSNDACDHDVNGGLSIDDNDEINTDANDEMSTDVNDEINTDVNGELSADVNDEMSTDVNGELIIEVNDDSDDVGQYSEEDISEIPFDGQLLMQTKVKLTRIHDSPQWKAHAKQNRYININKLMSSSFNDVTVKTETEDDDGSDIKLRYDSDTDSEYLPDDIMDSDFDDDIPLKMARLDASSAEGNLPIAKLPIDPSNPVKRKLMEAQEKSKKRKKPTKNLDVEKETPDCEEIVPMTDLQLLLQYLNVTTSGPSMPAPNLSYCCLARKHADMNSARQWSGQPALPPHKHDDGPCNCCCIELCEDRAWLNANAELKSLLKDINGLLEKSDKEKEKKRRGKYKPGPRSRKKLKKDTQSDKEDNDISATADTKAPSIPSTTDKPDKVDANATANTESKTDSVKETDVSKDNEEKTVPLDGLDEWIRQKNVNNQFFKLQGVNSKEKRTVAPVPVNNTPKTRQHEVTSPVYRTNRDDDVNKYQVKSRYELVNGIYRLVSAPIEKNQEIQTVNTQTINVTASNINNTPQIQTVQTPINDILLVKDVIKVPNTVNAERIVRPNNSDYNCANKAKMPIPAIHKNVGNISTSHPGNVIIRPKMRDSGGGIIMNLGQNNSYKNLVPPNTLSGPTGGMIPVRSTCVNPVARSTAPFQLRQPVNRPACSVYNTKSDIQKITPRIRNPTVRQRHITPCNSINMPVLQPGYVGMQKNPPLYQMPPQTPTLRQIGPMMSNNPGLSMQSNMNLIAPENGINSNNNAFLITAPNPQSSNGGHFLQNNSMHKMPPTIRRNSIGRQFSPNNIPKQQIPQVLPTATVTTPSDQIKLNNLRSAPMQDSTVLANLLTKNLIGIGEYLQQLPPQPVLPPIPTPVPPPTIGLIGPLNTLIQSSVTQTLTESPVTTTMQSPVTLVDPITVDLTREPSPEQECTAATQLNATVNKTVKSVPPNKIIILSSVTLNQKELASNPVVTPKQNGNQDSSTKKTEDRIDIKPSKRPNGVVEVDKSALNKIITPKTTRVESLASNSSDTAEPKNTGYEEWMRQKNINTHFFKPPRASSSPIHEKNKSYQNSTLKKKIFKPKYKEIKKHTRKKLGNEESCEEKKEDIELMSDASMESVISISSAPEHESTEDNTSQFKVLESEEKEISNDASSQDDSQASLTQETSTQNSITIHDALEQNKVLLGSATINSEILDSENEKSKLLTDTMEPSKDESTNDSEKILEDRPTNTCKIFSFSLLAKAPLQNEIILQDEEENNEIVAHSEINDLQVPNDIETVPVEDKIPVHDFDEYTEENHVEIYSEIPTESQPISVIPVYEEDISSDMPLGVQPEFSETLEDQEEDCSETYINNEVISSVRELPTPLNQFLIRHNLTPAPSASEIATLPEDTSITAKTLLQSSTLGKSLIYNPEMNNESILTQFTNNNYLTFNNNEINQQLTEIITTNPFHITMSAANSPADYLKDHSTVVKKSSQPLHIIIPERAALQFEDCFITPDSLTQNLSPHLHQSSPSNNHIPTLIVGEYPKERSEAPSPKTLKQDIYNQNSTFIQIPRDCKTNRKFQREKSHFRQDRNFSSMLSPEILHKTHIDVQIVGEYPSNKTSVQSSQSDTTKQNGLTGHERVILNANVDSAPDKDFVEVKSKPLIEVWGDYPSAQNKNKTSPTVIQGDINAPVKQDKESSKEVASFHRDLLKEAMSNLDLNWSEENSIDIDGDADPAQTLASVSENISESNALNELDSLTYNTSTDNDAALNYTDISAKSNETDCHTELNDVQTSPASELVSPKENIFTNNNIFTLPSQEADMDQHKEFGFTRPPLRLVQRRVADGIRKSAMFMVPSSSPGKNNIISLPQNHDKPISFENFDEQSPEVLGLDTDLLDPVRLIIPPNKPVTFTVDNPKAVLPKIDIATKRKRLLSGQYDKISDQTDYQVKHFQEIPVIPNEVVAEVQKAKLKQKSKSQEASKIITVAHKCKEQKRHSFSSLPPEVVIEELQPILMKEKIKKDCPQTIAPKPRGRPKGKPRGRPRGRPRLKSVPNLSYSVIPKLQSVMHDSSPPVQPSIQPLKPCQKRKRGRPRTVSWPGENNDSELDYVPIKTLPYELPKKCSPNMLPSIFNQTIPKMATIPKINTNKLTTQKRNKSQAMLKTSETTAEIKNPQKAKQRRVNSNRPVKQNVTRKAKKTKINKKNVTEVKLNKNTEVETLTRNEKTDKNDLYVKDPKPYTEVENETLTEDEQPDHDDVLNTKASKAIPCHIDTDSETSTEYNSTDNKNDIKQPEPISCYFKANFKSLTRNEKTGNNNVLNITDSKSIPCCVKAGNEIIIGNKTDDANVTFDKDPDQSPTINKHESHGKKEASSDEFNKTKQDTTESVVSTPATNTAVELKFKCSINLSDKDLPIRKRPYLRIMHETSDESTTASEIPNPIADPATIPVPEQSPLDLSEADKEYTQSLKDIRKISRQQSLPANITPKLRVSIPISPLSMESVVKIIRLKSIHIKIPSEEYDELKQRLIPDNRTLSAQVKPVAIPSRLKRRNSLCIMKNGRELPEDNISDITDEDVNSLATEYTQHDDGVAIEEANEPKIPSSAEKVKIIATNKKVIQAIRLKRQRQRQLIMQKWASCTQLDNIDSKEILTGPTKDQNMGKDVKSLIRFSSVDGTTEWYREIRNLVESPDLSEFDFEDFRKTFEEPTKTHEKAASDSVRVSIEEIPLPEAAEPTALEISLNDIPLPTDLPPVEMVLMSCFQDNSPKSDQTIIEEVACVADVPPKPTTPQPPPKSS